MKYKSILFAIALMFTNLHSMEADDCDNSESSTNQVLHQPESLTHQVANFLVRKLIDDIKAEVEGEKEVSYEEYLASCPLNEETKQLTLDALLQKESKILWKVLPCKITQQNLGKQFRDIIVLNDDQLLVLYNEPSESSNSGYNSKIKIWDMRSQGWVDIDFQLPEIVIANWLISKDLNTLFLWCYGSRVLVYSLTKNEVVSKIISGPAIKSICLFNDDRLVCCGLTDGNVSIFDKNDGKQIYSFKATNQSIVAIDAIDDVIVTVDPWHICRYKIDETHLCKYSESCSTSFENDQVHNFKLGLHGETMIISFSNVGRSIILFFSCPNLEFLKQYDFCPSFVDCKRSQDGKMFFAGEGIRSFYGASCWEEFDALSLLDAESGAIIRRFNFGEDIALFADDKSNIKWRGFAISPDNSFIILYDKQGLIAKISLPLDEGLESILAKIKSNFVKEKSKSQSRCVIS